MAGGFLWAANSPFVRGMWVRGRRAPKTMGHLSAETAVIVSADGQRHNVNPSHIIFECKTNPDWAEGSDPSLVDIASFQYAADVLYNEGFGLSLLWREQTDVESFIAEVLDHIQAYLFLNPRTGLTTLTLLRGDYDPDELETFDATNCSIIKFQRRALGETVNEIVVSWTNPENEKEETVAVQDLANIVSQGGQIVSDPRKYYAIRDSQLAVTCAARDLRAAAAPLAVGQLTVDRSAWSKTPGSVVKLNFPDRGINNVIIRIGDVDYGADDRAGITVSFTEDIFGLDFANYLAPPSTEWQSPSAAPTPMTHVRPFDMPLFLIANYSNQSVFDASVEFPEAVVGMLAVSSSPAVLSYELIGPSALANGSVIQASLGTKTPLGRAALTDDLPAENSSLVESFTAFIGTAPFLAGFVIFDGGSDGEDEYAMVQSIAPEGFTLTRGVLDTTPKEWPAGTPVWFLNLEQTFADESARAIGETVTYRLLTRTDQGLLDFDDAEDETFTLGDRPYLPLRPAAVSVEGEPFDVVALNGAGPFAVAWANRNRLTETSQVLPWDYGNVSPEAGQTTKIQVLDATMSVVFEDTAAEGAASYALAGASIGATAEGFIRVSSVRDGFDSLQGHIVPFTRV